MLPARAVKPAPRSQTGDSKALSWASEQMADGTPKPVPLSSRRALLPTFSDSGLSSTSSASLRALLHPPHTHSEAQLPPSAQALLSSKSKCQDHIPICGLEGYFICLTLLVAGRKEARTCQAVAWRVMEGADRGSKWASQGPDRPRGFRVL